MLPKEHSPKHSPREHSPKEQSECIHYYSKKYSIHFMPVFVPVFLYLFLYIYIYIYAFLYISYISISYIHSLALLCGFFCFEGDEVWSSPQEAPGFALPLRRLSSLCLRADQPSPRGPHRCYVPGEQFQDTHTITKSQIIYTYCYIYIYIYT